MAPTHLGTDQVEPSDRVRDCLLTALHVGRLRSGDRVPSIRRLAHLVGVNRKTVHRTYVAMAQDGILEMRPGSGTFVSDRRSGGASGSGLPALLGALETCRGEAERLGMDPIDLVRFMHAYLAGGFDDLKVGVVECNMEQIVMIARDLHRAIGVTVHPVPLDVLDEDPKRALSGVDVVVTTDCHWSDVAARVADLEVPAYAVAFDRQFPRHLLRLATEGEVLLVVGDRRFGPVFSRLLRQIATRPAPLRRVSVVEAKDAAATFLHAPRGSWVYVAPSLAATTPPRLPEHVRRVEQDWHVAAESMDTLRAGLAADRLARKAELGLSGR